MVHRLIPALLLVLALVALPFTAVAADDGTDVPMFRGNPAHTGEMPGPGPDPDRPIAERWSFTAGGPVNGSPAVVDGVVYVGSLDGDVYAIDAASGEQRWLFHAGPRVKASPAVVDDVVYMGSWDHNLYALDAASGEHRWSFATGDAVTSSPAVVDGVIYFGGEDA
jgi:hypothetical protein